jgi:hypothetical protein
VDPPDVLGVEGPLDGVGDRGDGRPLDQVRGPSRAGEVHVEHLEALGEGREDGGEVAPRAAPAVQQEERLAAPGAVDGQRGGHRPPLPTEAPADS